MTWVLIGYDGSDRAAEAVLAAGRLFPGARAVVLSVAHDPWAPEPPPRTTLTLAGPLVTTERRTGLSTARAIAQRGCDLAAAAGLEAEPVALGGGRPANQICRAARRHDVAAIVCGTHGHSEHRRAVTGSTATAVIHHADRPVLVVPSGTTTATATGPVVVGYDGREPSRRAVLTAGRLLGGRETAVVHAGPEALIAREGAALARELGLHCSEWTVEPRPSAAAAVAAVARSVGASVVVSGSRGRGAVASTLLGSFSTALIGETPSPVLIAKAPE
jgi:nucleotide-binding universal stress UspA family protein